MPTTIQISDSIKQHLDKIKMFKRESYNDVIEILIEDTLELNDKTKKEIEERANGKFISHEEIKKRFSL